MIPVLDETHDPTRRSWVGSADGHADFPIQNLPYGVFSTEGLAPRPGVAIGDAVLDLAACAGIGLLPEPLAAVASQPDLKGVLGLAPPQRVALRRRLSHLLSNPEMRAKAQPLLHSMADCELHLPAAIGDYTDFYAGIHHATNVGRQFRPDTPLLPNYKHVPIAYHGRASSIRPSGAEVCRPNGQRKAADETAPSFGPSRRLDYELEMGVWIAGENPLGQPIPIARAADRIAGLCLLNDWSARDLQAWEYQPLGPFLAKSFHTTISPWVVTTEALAPFRIPQSPRPPGDPKPLPYLWDDADQAAGVFAITLEVRILTSAMRRSGAPAHRLSQGPMANLYWTVAQMVAHHASNGCNLSTGDLLGTGTISGPEAKSFGSLLEITRGGTEPLSLPNGERRSFLEDGDEVLMSATAQAQGRVPIGFGPCRAVIAAAA